MNDSVETAAVLGAGVMGAAIAAHLANAGVRTLLLDLESEGDANARANAGIKAVLKGRPPGFFSAAGPALVQPGNFRDDLPKLGHADWIIEAIVENLDIKQSLWKRVAEHANDSALLSTNTSGISIASIAEALPKGARARFLGTHFFNPPRYLKLLELIRGPDTAPEALATAEALGRDLLGKGIVIAKDTPNFIANRIGVFAMMHAVHAAIDAGLSVAEVDALTGTLIGRPKSATYRTADVVGLDTLTYVAENLAERLTDDPGRAAMTPPAVLRRMIDAKRLGEKTGEGFYKRVKTEAGREIRMLDFDSFEYVPQPDVSFASVAAAKKQPDMPSRLAALVAADDEAGRYLWNTLSATLVYAAQSIPEISDDVLAVDRAMEWGFGWSAGPFALWDALGVEATAKRLEAEGVDVPPLVSAVLATPERTFYSCKEDAVYDPRSKRHAPIPRHPRHVRVGAQAAAGKTIHEDEHAALVDLGEDVACFAFKTKANTITLELVDALHRAIDRVEKSHRGLVIGNDAEHFSAGANLALLVDTIERGDFEAVENAAKAFQGITSRLRFSRRPVVVATRGRVLGGGCELALGADRVCAAAESYIGLVEVGVGIIPAGGGCKELVKRAHEAIPENVEADPFPYVRRIFETVGTARVAGSAIEAQDLGLLDRHDRVTMNGDFLLADARDLVLSLDLAGYRPPTPRTDIRVLGAPALATLRSAMHNFREARRITDYDRVVGDRLAWVITGGDVSGPERVSEEYLLALERDAFVSLAKDERTLARMKHLLATGKPLRN